jgi:hypothetical protein
VQKRAREAFSLAVAALTALLAPQFVAVLLLICGIALVGEAVRMLAGSGYALLTWGVALILVSIIVMRGVNRG